MPLDTAFACSDALMKDLLEASRLPDPGERLRLVNEAWRTHGLPVQQLLQASDDGDLALSNEGQALSKVYRRMLGVFGEASLQAVQVSAASRRRTPACAAQGH